MAIDVELEPKAKRAKGERGCEPSSTPTSGAGRRGKVCVCEVLPLFGISQPTLSHHLRKVRAAGIVDSACSQPGGPSASASDWFA